MYSESLTSKHIKLMYLKVSLLHSNNSMISHCKTVGKVRAVALFLFFMFPLPTKRGWQETRMWFYMSHQGKYELVQKEVPGVDRIRLAVIVFTLRG